ncbi:MAG: hypothetical protein KF708_05250 [Pirellulales bacterium]|nr:hypothetical protein [Pirellulales bacterium]
MTKKPELNRRNFSKLSMAAFGGLMAGTMVGCGAKTEKVTPEAESDATPVADSAGDTVAEKHVCRGLNSCQGKGVSGDNACAGQGTCATTASHSCHAENECKGLGGCGESVAANECKGKGECAVPLGDAAWEKARAAFEKKMADVGKTVGAAPAK